MSSDVELYRDNTAVFLTEQDKRIFAQVDEIVSESVEARDPSMAMAFGRELRKNVRVSGVALAKLCWSVVDKWGEYYVEDSVWDVIHSEMGVPPGTSRPYVRIWESVFANPDVPDEAKERFFSTPIRTLKLLPALSSEEDVDWVDLSTSVDHGEMRNKVREIRGEATSSGTSLYIKMDVRNGQLSAKQGDKPYVPFGIINLTLAKSDPVVAHAIERLVERVGIIES